MKMLWHAGNFTWSLNGLMIAKIKHRKLFKFRNHVQASVFARRCDMLSKSIGISKGSGKRNGCCECISFDAFVFKSPFLNLDFGKANKVHPFFSLAKKIRHIIGDKRIDLV